MPISFLDTNIGTTFFSLLESTENQVHIISPFIGFNTALNLSKIMEEATEDIECILITRFYREDFLNKVSSLAGLELLANAGVRIFALQNLHSKLYIFDEKSIIMGSANFTFNGFYRNHEFGVFMENELEFSKECNYYFNNLLQEIKNAGAGAGEFEVKLDRIQKEKRICDKIVDDRANSQRKQGKNSSPVTTFPNPARWGAEIPTDNRLGMSNDKKDLIENALSNELNEAVGNRNTGIWLKFEGNSEKRIPNDVSFIERRKKEHYTRTFFPRPPRSIKEGQFLFMTMVSKDDSGEDTPIIVGYTKSSGFNEKNITHGEVPYSNNKNARYPYFVEMVEGRFLKAPIKYGISLRELARELGSDLYPNKKSNFHEIIYTHRQKSHIQITEKAQNYLIKRLEDLFMKYGVDEI